MADELQDRLDEQLTYYRARAPEYDAWALREGPFDRGRDNAKWFAEIAKLEERPRAVQPHGEGPGAGRWHRAVDGAPGAPRRRAHGRRCLRRGPRVQPAARRRRRAPHPGGSVLLEARPAIRRRLLLVLALPRAARALPALLGSGRQGVATRWARVLHRQHRERRGRRAGPRAPRTRRALGHAAALGRAGVPRLEGAARARSSSCVVWPISAGMPGRTGPATSSSTGRPRVARPADRSPV